MSIKVINDGINNLYNGAKDLYNKGKDVAVSAGNTTKGIARDILFNDNPVVDPPGNIPFANVANATMLSLLGEDKAILGEDAKELIQNDPAMQAYEQEIIADIKADPRYGNEAFEVTFEEGVEFGGQKADGDMWDQAKDPLNPEYRDTWEVAGNELTWLIRHAGVKATAHVDADGNIKIDYKLEDTLDLEPNRPDPDDPYNQITAVLGNVYHDILGGSAMDIEATWSTEIQA